MFLGLKYTHAGLYIKPSWPYERSLRDIPSPASILIFSVGVGHWHIIFCDVSFWSLYLFLLLYAQLNDNDYPCVYEVTTPEQQAS